MNSLSLSGKSWVLKPFNQEDLNFIKDNFSLDEITSKLLSIRKIKTRSKASKIFIINEFTFNKWKILDFKTI